MIEMEHILLNKIYIASSSKFIGECKVLSVLLERDYNITITRKWWDHYIKDSFSYPNDMKNSDFYFDPQVQLIRELDFQAIRESDMVICLVNGKYKLTGALIEVGYALAFSKPVIMFGEPNRSAMISSCIHISTVKELRKVLERAF